MTQTNKQIIFELRIKGLGYKAVAGVLGLNRDEVRQFCKHSGLEGTAQVVDMNIREKVKNKELCANCYITVNQKETGRPRKFCSDNCRRQWWKLNRIANVKKALNEEMEDGI